MIKEWDCWADSISDGAGARAVAGGVRAISVGETWIAGGALVPGCAGHQGALGQCLVFLAGAEFAEAS